MVASKKLVLACLAVAATPASAVLLEVPSEKPDESLKLGRSRSGSSVQHLAGANLDQATTRAAKMERNELNVHTREYLKSQAFGQVEELMLSGKGTDKVKGAPDLDPAKLLDIAIDAGQEDSFVALADGMKTKMLTFSTNYVTEVETKCNDFKEAIAADHFNEHSKKHVKKLLEDLKTTLAEQQSSMAIIVKKVRQAMPENLRTLLSSVLKPLGERPANPFDVDLKGFNGVAEQDQSIACEQVGLVFAGFGPYTSNILKTHMWLNSTAPTLKLANQNSKAFLVPRLTGMLYLGVLSFEEGHRIFNKVAAPLIKHRLHCGHSAAHVDEEWDLSSHQHDVLKRREQKQLFQWLQTETLGMRTKAVAARLDETMIKDMKQAIKDAQTEQGSQELEKYMKSRKIAAQDYMATFLSEVKVAGQEFVAESLNTSTRYAWGQALGGMAKKIATAETRMFEDGKTWRTRLDELLPKELMPFAVKFLQRANDDAHMLHLGDTSQCKDIVTAFENAAFKHGYHCVAKLDDLDKEAYAVDAASGKVTVMQNILEAAYTEALGQREAVHALISTVGPAIGAKRFGCPGVNDHLRGTKWWKEDKM